MPRPKLQNRERYPSGQAKPDRSDPVARVRAIIAVARKEMPILDGPIGRLRFAGVLDDRDVAAANHFLKVRARYDAVMGLPAPNARSPAYGEARAGGSGVEDERAVLRARNAWDGLWRAIDDRKTIGLMHQVILCDEEPAWGQYQSLRKGLRAVAATMGVRG